MPPIKKSIILRRTAGKEKEMEEKKDLFIEEVTHFEQEENKRVLEAYATAIKEIEDKNVQEKE